MRPPWTSSRGRWVSPASPAGGRRVAGTRPPATVRRRSVTSGRRTATTIDFRVVSDKRNDRRRDETPRSWALDPESIASAPQGAPPGGRPRQTLISGWLAISGTTSTASVRRPGTRRVTRHAMGHVGGKLAKAGLDRSCGRAAMVVPLGRNYRENDVCRALRPAPFASAAFARALRPHGLRPAANPPRPAPHSPTARAHEGRWRATAELHRVGR